MSLEHDPTAGLALEPLEPLDPRAARLLHVQWSILLAVALLPSGVLLALGALLPTRVPGVLPAIALTAIALVLLGWWTALRRLRRTRFALDDDGLHIHRGLLWRHAILVPRSRVQHLDLQRGPLERRFGLATLALHTAGTQQQAISLSGLALERAHALRDALVDRDGGDDDAV